MDNKVVVGVGNIYASEALFKAGIRPDRACGKISRNRYKRLVQSIKETLAKAIEQEAPHCGISSVVMANPVISNRRWPFMGALVSLA